eukprot:14994698-Ditylum_brightwellii.AAC.1
MHLIKQPRLYPPLLISLCWPQGVSGAIMEGGSYLCLQTIQIKYILGKQIRVPLTSSIQVGSGDRENQGCMILGKMEENCKVARRDVSISEGASHATPANYKKRMFALKLIQKRGIQDALHVEAVGHFQEKNSVLRDVRENIIE